MSDNSRTRRPSFPGTAPSPEAAEEWLPPVPHPVEESPEEGRRRAQGPIGLMPVGDFSENIPERILQTLSQVFRREVVVSKPLPVPKYAYNPSRGQYHAASILKRVEESRSPDWSAAVGLVALDLFVPEVPFVFGEGDRSTQASIVSLVRLRSESATPELREDILWRRLGSELVHQVGLIRGLAHCPNNRCVMFPATVTQEIDKRGSALCANCRKRFHALENAGEGARLRG
jgi:archaemetzincin